MNDPCIMCGENESMPGKDICSMCGSDAKSLGPEADVLLGDNIDYEHRMAQESGEVFEGEVR